MRRGGCKGGRCWGPAVRPPRSVSISPRSPLWCLAGEAASPLGSNKPACDAGPTLERPGPPSPAPPTPAADHGERRVPKHRRPLARPASQTSAAFPGPRPRNSTNHQDWTSPRDSGIGIASLNASLGGIGSPPPSHHCQEGRGDPQLPSFPSCWGAAPSLTPRDPCPKTPPTLHRPLHSGVLSPSSASSFP